MSLPVVSSSLSLYLAEVNRYPVLRAEEEQEVTARYYESRSIEDAHKLVTSNLRYVVKVALEYRHYGCKLSDLIQEGNIGLMVAVKKFNPHKGFRLITYAAWWIRSYIQDFIMKTRTVVKRSSRALKKKLFYKNPVPEGMKAEDFSMDLSLDAPIADEKTTHLDLLRDTRPGQEEAAAERQTKALVKREVSEALAVLNDKERFVIEERVMAEEPESLQGIGDKLGLTRERVRQIEGTALKKLGKTLSEKLSLPGGESG